MIYGDLTIDPRAREIHIGGTKIDLTAREYELFAFLASHPRQVFSREELLENVWGTRFQDPATVTEHVRRVRAKIEKHPPTRKVLTTLRGWATASTREHQLGERSVSLLRRRDASRRWTPVNTRSAARSR